MSIPEPPHELTPPAGWYPTGETGPVGQPMERWWDGTQWSTAVRPLGSTAPGPGAPAGPKRGSRAKSLIAAGLVVVLVAAGVGIYFAVGHNSSNSPAASPQSTPTAGSGNDGQGDGQGDGGATGGNGPGGGTNGLGGIPGLGATPTPAPTVAGGAGQTVSDPIDGLTIPVPSGWTGSSGSTSGEGSWPVLSTGPYTCPSALAQANGSSTAQCTRGGVSFTTTSGTAAQSVATSDIADLAKSNYGTLSSHTVVNQGAITVAGRAGYQITWSVVPDYTGPSGTVEVIAVPVPSQSGYFALIDIGVDQSAQAPSLTSVNTQIISDITDSDATGA